MEKVVIAGKYTRNIEDILRGKGYEIIEPDISRAETIGDAWSIMVHAVRKCDILFMLHGWENSELAVEQHKLAQSNNIKIEYL